ncbi:MAG: M67 family metallopeptidase [Bacteroidales bacterium]|nr:M67 family metallopeptidase [Bacteroidales bacterium]
MEKISIKKEIVDKIIKHAQDDLPIEACGYLAGENNIITKRFILTNIDNSPEHFSFDPKEQFAVLNKCRAQNLEIIANYHSHPVTPSRPSREDIKLAYDPNILYFIVSLAGDKPDIKAYRINNSKVKNIHIEIVT